MLHDVWRTLYIGAEYKHGLHPTLPKRQLQLMVTTFTSTVLLDLFGVTVDIIQSDKMS